MKKNVLALSVVAALSSLALAGCGGGGDGASSDNGNNGETAKPALTGTFIDSPVEGLNYTCGSHTDVTGKEGQFLFNDGDTCEFKLGSVTLGETIVKKGQTMVTPYTIAETGNKERAVRIAALLQTMDDDNKPENGITLKKEDVTKLGNTIRFDSDEAFNTSLHEALKQAQIDKKVVDTTAAEAHMNASLAVINGQSVAVDKVLRSLLEESQDWQKTNFEEKLREYKETLNEETGDQGKADREVVKSIIILMEITNDPIVSNRFDIQPPSDLGQGYQTSLAKVLDIIVNPLKMTYINIKEQPSQIEDISRLMGKYALELESISNTLANIVKPDYLAKYGDDDKLTLNFAQVQELRATALAMSSAMNVISAYQYGSASHFKVAQENVTFDNFTTITKWLPYPEKPITTYLFNKQTVNAEYLNVNIHPAELFNDQLFLTFTKEYKTQLSKAKSQLQESIAIALTTDITINLDIDRAELINLQQHLNGTKSGIELSERVMIGDKYDYGYYADAKYTIDLNPFFALGFDRNDITLTIKESCKHRNYDVIGEYDESLSKAMDTAMCHMTESDVKGIYSPYYNDDFEYIGNSENINPETGNIERHPTFAQGFPMRWFVEMKAKPNSSFGKIFTSCKVNKKDGNQDQWQPMPCDELISHSLSD